MNQNDCIWDADPGPFSACYPDGSCEESYDSYWIYLQAGQRFANPYASCLGDLNGDGIDDGCGCPTDVPATSSYVMIVGAVLLLIASAAFLLRRRSAP
jgi:MYXO-CTERM domain-containing protein